MSSFSRFCAAISWSSSRMSTEAREPWGEEFIVAAGTGRSRGGARGEVGSRSGDGCSCGKGGAGRKGRFSMWPGVHPSLQSLPVNREHPPLYAHTTRYHQNASLSPGQTKRYTTFDHVVTVWNNDHREREHNQETKMKDGKTGVESFQRLSAENNLKKKKKMSEERRQSLNLTRIRSVFLPSCREFMSVQNQTDRTWEERVFLFVCSWLMILLVNESLILTPSRPQQICLNLPPSAFHEKPLVTPTDSRDLWTTGETSQPRWRSRNRTISH